MIPDIFEGLISNRRLDFLEIACEPDSVLSETFIARTGRSDSASRCSLWSGHDLSRPEGLAMTLEQIRVLRPKMVWISPPCGPYSPMQNVNQRNSAQIRDLQAKREVAKRIYESTREIVKTCLQMGTHVTVQVSEKSEAWRLLVFQDLRYHMGLFSCVVKGCAVGLKGQEGLLMQKGWRLVTSHQRLSEMLAKPCRCPANYKHAKCEGKNAVQSARYTREFARLVYEALSREGSFTRVVQECSGRS